MVRERAGRAGLGSNTVAAYEYELSLLLWYFKDHRLSDITFEKIEGYKRANLQVRTKRGKALSAETINKTLTRLRQVLAKARRYADLAGPGDRQAQGDEAEAVLPRLGVPDPGTARRGAQSAGFTRIARSRV